jgi:hypothetical protein
LTIKKQAIQLATQESASFSNDPMDGILGLAFPSAASVKGIKTPISNLIASKKMTKPVFGVWLGSDKEGGGGGKSMCQKKVQDRPNSCICLFSFFKLRIHFWWL